MSKTEATGINKVRMVAEVAGKATSKKPAAKAPKKPAAKAPAKKKAKAEPAPAPKKPAAKRTAKAKIVPDRSHEPHIRLQAMSKDHKLAVAEHLGLGKHKTGKDAHVSIMSHITRKARAAGTEYSAGAYAPFTGKGGNADDRSKIVGKAKDAATKKVHDAIDHVTSGKPTKTAKVPAKAEPAAKKPAAKKARLGKGMEELTKEATPNKKLAGDSPHRRVAEELEHAGVKTGREAHAALHAQLHDKHSYAPNTAQFSATGKQHADALPAPKDGESAHAYAGRAVAKGSSAAILIAARNHSHETRGHTHDEANQLSKKGGGKKVLADRLAATANVHHEVLQAAAGSHGKIHSKENSREGYKNKVVTSKATVTHADEAASAMHGHHAAGALANMGFKHSSHSNNHITMSHPVHGEVTIKHSKDEDGAHLHISHTHTAGVHTYDPKSNTHKEEAASKKRDATPDDVHDELHQMLREGGFKHDPKTGHFHHKNGSVAKIERTSRPHPTKKDKTIHSLHISIKHPDSKTVQ